MKKILVVDDDTTFLSGMKIALSKNDRQIETAKNVGRAIEILRENKTDLICSDYDMPDGTALNLLEFVKNKNMNIPVIIISGRDEEKYVKNALDMGVVEYFSKGNFSLEKIRKCIASIL